ncbi:MAG TPA: hypothetical protein VGG42_18840 [Acidobacteriaceae bacterium]|jgi:hypothetical protein
MPKNQLEPVNLGSIARGAAIELFDLNMPKIAANIADTTTPAKGKRKLTLTFTFEPDADRQAIEVTTTAELKLASAERHQSRAFMGKDTSGKPYLFPTDPRQEALFDPPEPEENLLQFGKADSKRKPS